MYLTLQVDSAQHDGGDLLAHRRIVPRAHELPGILDAGNLDEPEGRIAEINEKPEPVMAQHYPCHPDTAGEA